MDSPPSGHPFPAAVSSRFVFIDRLRGWAVFVMIETHVVNALLRPELKVEPFFKVLSFFNGLVAPSFLFCAGFAFALTARRKDAAFLGFGPAFRQSLNRLLFLLGVAYSLHLPFFSLHRLRELEDPSAWIPFFQVDILQTIAVTLLVMTVILPLVRRWDVRYWLFALLLLGAVFCAPVVRDLDYSAWPPWLRTYLTTQFKSQFPLFPWSAFVLAGAFAGWYALDARTAGKEPLIRRRILAGAGGMIVVALIAEVLPLEVYPNHAFFRASPEFFFVRLGLVLMSMVGLWSERREAAGPRATPLLLFGQESLLVYVTHLLIVYGYTYEFSFVRLFGPTLNYGECVGLFLLLAAAMVLLAYAWHSIKHFNKTLGRVVQYAFIAGVAITFVLKTT